MNVYAATGFSGHWPVGTAAVIIAPSAERAVELLNKESRSNGLPGDATVNHLTHVCSKQEQVLILNDGDY